VFFLFPSLIFSAPCNTQLEFINTKQLGNLDFVEIPEEARFSSITRAQSEILGFLLGLKINH
jgi:hypothetical protein